MDYYSAIKKNGIMPFATAWMDLDIIVQNEVKSDRGGEILLDIFYMWTLRRNDTNELICKTERDSRTWRRSLQLPGAKDGRKQ